MKEEHKTKKKLIEELAELRGQIAGLESSPGKQDKREAKPVESAHAIPDLAEEQGMLLHYTRDFVYRHDTRGVFTYISPSVETITGYKAEEWLRHYTTYLTDNPINEKVIAYTDETLQTGQAIPLYLAEIRHRDGRKIMLEVNEQPYFKDGKVAGIIGVARDVTERKKAEEELHEACDKLEMRVRERTAELEAINRQLQMEIAERGRAEEQLRIMHSAVESSVNAIALCDLKGNLTYVNESFLTLWGYNEAGEVLGKSCRAFWEDGEKAVEIYEKIKGMESWAGELTARRKDGMMFEVHLSANAVVSEAGNPIQLMASFIDVTERRKAEEALRESEKKYRVLFDEAADSIAIIDIEGNFLDLNKRFEEESGWSREEMTGKNVFTLGLLTEPSAKKAASHLSRLIEGEEPPIFEIEGINRKGEMVPYEVRATPIKKDGKTVAVQAILRNITERRQSEEKIVAMAYYDALTELPNRYLFKDRLKQAIIAAKQYKRLAAVLFLDLDNFKRVNDTLGHEMGDQLLQSVSERLVNFVRRSDTIARVSEYELTDTVARLGGDEFTILLTEIAHIEDAAKVAQRVLDLFSRPFKISENELFISSSIGISIYPDNGDDIDALLKNADTAMYHAKDEGRNNFQFYAESMNVAISERFSLENKLRKAIKSGELLLYYQPQVDMRDRTIFGVEALVRWNHPEKGLLSPKTFIPLAEDTGLIVPIGEWVLRTACTQNKAWHAAGFEQMQVTVNISSSQFRQKNFLETVTKVLDDTGMDPSCLELELTESIFMETTETTISTLKALKAIGARISIDDFGTGYSSLSYLKRFPIDTLKIDRAFVRDITTDPDDRAIVKAIIAMSHSLNLRVIAEGVETAQQLSLLSQQGSDGIQGHLFSPPLPPHSFLELLKDGGKAFEYLWSAL